MSNRLALALALALPLAACKDKTPEETKEPTTEPVAEVTTVVEDAAPADAPAPPKLTEKAQTLFASATEIASPLQWQLTGEAIALRAEVTKLEGDATSFDAKVMAQIQGAEGESEVFACNALKAASNGRIDLVLRGDKLHILCIHPVQGEDQGSTDAARFAFDLGKREFAAAGTYGGDGTLDLDTIDLDEGE
jgi:hypothetical protein